MRRTEGVGNGPLLGITVWKMEGRLEIGKQGSTKSSDCQQTRDKEAACYGQRQIMQAAEW
jgi:hypothetical protein